MAVTAPCTADEALATAISQLGVSESPPKSNKQPYGAWYPANGQAWCAMFVSWCLHHAGFPIQITTAHGFAYCPYGVDWFKKQGAWAPANTRPKRGWVVFFDFPGDGVNRPSHTGLVEGVLADGRVATVEGNTNDAGGRTGGMVMRHNRTPSGGIIGYGIIDYAGAASTPALPSGPSAGILTSGHSLKPGQSITAGDWTLAFQTDGNLVLYHGAPTPGNAHWTTQTVGSGAQSLDMQPDGNLCLNRASGAPAWNSGTPGNSGAYLQVQSDGNVVILNSGGTPIWDRLGNVKRSGPSKPTAPPFPLASGHWFGVASPDSRNHSGAWVSDQPLVARLIDQFRARGWKLPAGNRYTADVQKVVVAFQKEKGLGVDGKVGAKTWTAMWSAPT